MKTEENLKNLLISLGVENVDEMMGKFEIYFENLVSYNQNVNLTAITERDEVFEKHFLDSILPAKEFKTNATICDIGTGAGFPGIPLAIINHGFKVFAVDSLNKRVDFLDMLKDRLNLDNVQNFHARAEDFAKTHREEFDYVVSRAVSKLNTLSEYCLPLVKKGGYMVAYKSISYGEELNEATNAIKILGGKVEKIAEYDLENAGQKRYIIFIKKVSDTPKKYPRGQNKPKLSPL